MKTLATFVFVSLIPVAALGANINAVNGVDPIRISSDTDWEMNGGPELGRCQGKKCAGPGDKIRNEQGVQESLRLAGSRGGEATSGDKKGSRRHGESKGIPLLAGNRGGRSSAGSKKGRRHYDERGVEPVCLT